MEKIYRLVLPLIFPAGISIGQQRDRNLIKVDRDGQGKPVLRGSTLAGALRHAWSQLENQNTPLLDAGKWFGSACNEQSNTGASSPLRVSNCQLDIGKLESQIRTYNAIDRHTGAAIKGGLFSLEVLPPGTETTALLELTSDNPEAELFLTQLVGIITVGLTLGGHIARGIGHMQCNGKAKLRVYDPSKLDDMTAYLDDVAANQVDDQSKAITSQITSRDLSVAIELAVPLGQDILIGDGQALDHEIEPQQVTFTDGSQHWRLAGSSLRGIFRAWFTRLAARSGATVSDHLKRHLERIENEKPLKGEEIMWGFASEDERSKWQENPALVPCPIMKLFGSGYAKGRIHITDAYCKVAKEKETQMQTRMHVAIDRISGGANDGMLFDNAVLVANEKISFPVKITIKTPSEQEVDWLVKTLRALDLGILRVGSSKSAGRLALASTPKASGPYAEKFPKLTPACEV